MRMKICLNCTFVVLLSDNYCTMCGLHFVKEPKIPECGRCGYYIPGYANFCGRCGLDNVKALAYATTRSVLTSAFLRGERVGQGEI